MMRYTKEHEWVNIEGTSATVGISHHAQEALGDITFVELPTVGKALKAGDPLGVVESVKAASDILAPLDGEIVEVNEALVDNPTLVNEDPTGEAWFFKFKLDDPSAMDDLLDEDAYAALIE